MKGKEKENGWKNGREKRRKRKIKGEKQKKQMGGETKMKMGERNESENKRK
jgi:hypothetical protein